LTWLRVGPKLWLMTTPKLVRLSLLAAGLAFAAPSFASVVPLCDGHSKGEKDAKQSEKNKSETKDKKDEKKPSNPS